MNFLAILAERKAPVCLTSPRLTRVTLAKKLHTYALSIVNICLAYKIPCYDVIFFFHTHTQSEDRMSITVSIID